MLAKAHGAAAQLLARLRGELPAADRLAGFLMLLLVAAALGGDPWRNAAARWQAAWLPGAPYHGRITAGVSVSLNALERAAPAEAVLPAFAIRGVLFDPMEQDWVLFGEADPDRPRLPVDAIAIALRALRLHLDAPGVDIAGGGEAGQAAVTYFGGVDGTAVGAWLFHFDRWMKRLALGAEAPPVDGVPVYWHEAARAWEREIASARPAGGLARQSRFWLCSGDIRTIEDRDALVLEEAPLRVLTEPVAAGGGAGELRSPPCASRGNDDAAAVAVAEALSARLDQLHPAVPIREIGDFVRLLAGFSWLMQLDRHRDLRPWLERATQPTVTPGTVEVMVRQAETERPAPGGGRYRYRLAVSGGVSLGARLVRFRSLDDGIERLAASILGARPDRSAVSWRFAVIGRITDMEGGSR